MLGIQIGFALMVLVFLGLAVHQGVLALSGASGGGTDTLAAALAALGCVVAALGTVYVAWKVR